MRKLLLIIFMLYCAGGYAQQSNILKIKEVPSVNPSLFNKCMPVPLNRNIDNNTPPINRSSATTPKASSFDSRATLGETVIGYTNYDLQTNNGISNRFVNNAGKLSAAWTFSPNGDDGYPLRGTGYNYFDGSKWDTVRSTRIENVRTGFTNIGVTSTGKEVVIAHGIQTSGVVRNYGMILSSRDAQGQGAWTTSTTVLGEEPTDTIDIWPKVAVGGNDGKTVHAIWRGGSTNNKIQGLTGPIFYSRSIDDGVTWDKLQTLIPELDDTTAYLGWSADEYTIDARDSVVAIVASALGDDVVLVKSTDNGNTWTRTYVSKFPLTKYDDSKLTTDTNADNTADTLWSGTGDANLVIDNFDQVHVFFSATRVVCSQKRSGNTGGLMYFPYQTYLFYWNESMGDVLNAIAYIPDLNHNGTIDVPAVNTTYCPNDPDPFGRYGLYRVIEQPTAGVDQFNNIYVCYQTIDELSEPNTVSNNYDKVFKHPYVKRSLDGGDTWTPDSAAIDIVLASMGSIDGEMKEGVFACMAKNVDSKVHIIYQRDDYPGNSLAASTTCEGALNLASNPANEIVYIGVDTSFATIGVHELAGKSPGVIVSSNYPNPASTYTQFNITLNSARNVKVDVEDILGQNIYSENKGKLAMGVHKVTLNTAYLSSGIYFYTVTAGNEKVTGKMLVR